MKQELAFLSREDQDWIFGKARLVKADVIDLGDDNDWDES